ncbi:MAG: hypothetical protein PHW96_03345 [Candidatus Nanoarchaeia archaeon]|nr:hypothetical protein [Candidatus Nanoarchaeia archaeon]
MKNAVFFLLFAFVISNAFAAVCGDGVCEPGELETCESDCAQIKIQIENMKQGQTVMLVIVIGGSAASAGLLVINQLMKKKSGNDVDEFIKRKQQTQTAAVQQQNPQRYKCPTCKESELTWIPKYKRWYCYKCKKWY